MCVLCIHKYKYLLLFPFNEQLKSELQDVDGVAITTDGGTNNRVNKYQAVTGHWINHSWNIVSAVLALVPMSDRATAENLQQVLQTVIKYVL